MQSLRSEAIQNIPKTHQRRMDGFRGMWGVKQEGDAFVVASDHARDLIERGEKILSDLTNLEQLLQELKSET